MQEFKAALIGGDEITLNLDILANGQIQSGKWKIIGRTELLEKAKNLKISGNVKDLKAPSGHSVADLLLKELILKVKGQWPDAPKDPELCHCRKIPQVIVERAVILGAHTVEKVRQRCSANTGCGTCLPDVEEIISYYLD